MSTGRGELGQQVRDGRGVGQKASLRALSCPERLPAVEAGDRKAGRFCAQGKLLSGQSRMTGRAGSLRYSPPWGKLLLPRQSEREGVPDPRLPGILGPQRNVSSWAR